MNIVLHQDVINKLEDIKQGLSGRFVVTFNVLFALEYKEHEMCFNGVYGFMRYQDNNLTVEYEDLNTEYYIGFCYKVNGSEVFIDHVDIDHSDIYA